MAAQSSKPGSSQTSALSNRRQLVEGGQRERKRQKKQQPRIDRQNSADAQSKVAGPSDGRGKKRSNDVADAASWPWLSLTETSHSAHPPVFTKDYSYFFAITGTSVRIYSTETGSVVSTLSCGEAGSHTAAITSMALNPHDPFQLITGSLDGKVKLWDFLDATLTRTIDVEHPIHFIAAHEQLKDQLFVATAKRRKGNHESTPEISDDGLVLRLSFEPTRAAIGVHKPLEVMLVGKTRRAHGLSISPSGTWLVATAGHKAYVASTNNLKAGFTKFVSPQMITCLAFHPIEEYFATGDAKGVIRLWYCLDTEMTNQTLKGVEKRAPTTTLHWHAHSVSCLSFTPNGAYLLSGGEESVLVLWQLHSGKKEFVPRVGAPIVSIAVSSHREREEYLLSLVDSSFVFISSSTLKISRSLSHIKIDASSLDLTSRVPAPLAIHPTSQTIILPSPGSSSLQMYMPSQSKLVAELEISPSNRVSRRDEDHLARSHVEHSVTSSCGEWMATIDTRETTETFHGESYLKIWSWDKNRHVWESNTRIDRPHGLSKVTAVSFSPTSCPLLVTAGGDGTLKTWRLRGENDKKQVLTERHWVLRSTLSFRNYFPRHVSWSPDTSLLSVSIGAFAAVYDPFSNTCISKIPALGLQSTVLSSHFLGNSGRYLAVVCGKGVILFDLVLRQAVLHYRSGTAIVCAVSHPHADRIAIFERKHPHSRSSGEMRVTLLSPHNNIPLQQTSLPFLICTALWYPPPSLDRRAESFSIVGITTDGHAVLFGDEVPMLSDPRPNNAEVVPSFGLRSDTTLFQDIFGISALVDLSRTSAALSLKRPLQADSAKTLSDDPAYLQPSVDIIFDLVMSSFLQHREDAETLDADTVNSGDRIKAMGMGDNISNVDKVYTMVGEEDVISLVDLFKRVAVKPSLECTDSSRIRQKMDLSWVASQTVTPKYKRTKRRRATPNPQESYPSPESTPSLTEARLDGLSAGKRFRDTGVS